MIVPRAPKELGNLQFAEEVAEGKLDIVDVELDEDLNRVFNNVNGNLDNSNIRNGAAIVYEKLTLTGKIKTTDLASDFKLPGTSYVNNTIPGASIVNNSITSVQLTDGVFVDSINNLGLNTTSHLQTCPSRADSFEFISGNDTILLTVDDAGTRGGPIFVLGYIVVSSIILGGGTDELRAMLRFGAPPTPPIVVEYTVRPQFGTTADPTVTVPTTLVLPYINGLKSGPLRYQLGLQHTNLAGGNYARAFHVFSALFVSEQA